MPALLIRKVRTRQPDRHVGINEAHPSAFKVLDAWLPQSMTSKSCRGRVPNAKVAADLSTGKFGVGISARSGGQSIKYNVGAWGESGSYAFLAICEFIDYTSTYSIVRRDGACSPAQISSGAATVRGIPWSPVDTGRNYFGSSPGIKRSVVIANRVSQSTFELWADGVKVSTTTALSGYGTTGNPLCFLGTESNVELATSNAAKFYGGIAFNKGLTDQEIIAFSKNPWQLFAPEVIPLYWTAAGGGPVTHATTGALTGSGAAVAGSANHAALHTTTGSITGAGASVQGSSTRFRAFTSTGSLSGIGASVAGVAQHNIPHVSTGALSAQWANVTGAAARNVSAVTHATTGAATGPGATLSGASARFRAFAETGALSGPGSLVAGTALRFRAFSETGTITGAGSQVAGTAARFHAFSSTGAITGAASGVVGTAGHTGPHATTGALSASLSAISGAAIRNAAHAASGALAGDSPAVSGTAARAGAAVTHTASGALVADISSTYAAAYNGVQQMLASLGGGSYPVEKRKRKETIRDDDDTPAEAISSSEIERIQTELLSDAMAADIKARAVKVRKQRAEEEALLLML